MLKPQDPVILAWIACSDSPFTFSQLAQELGLSSSVIFESLRRCAQARLFDMTDRRLSRPAFRRFVMNSVEFLYPCEPGPLAEGLPTGWHPSLFPGGTEEGEYYVWADGEGAARGRAIPPIIKAVPSLARRNHDFRKLIALIDVMRLGGRNREGVEAELQGLLPDLPAGDVAARPDPAPIRRCSEDDRRRVAAVAERVFAEKGFQAPADDVARAAGLTAPDLHGLFPERAHLENEVLRRMLEKLGVAFCGPFTQGSLGNLSTLRTTLGRMVSLIDHDPDFHRLQLWLALQPAMLSRVADAVMGPVVSQTADFIGGLTRAGDPGDAEARALIFLAFSRMYAELRWGYAEHVLPVQRREEFLSRTIAILKDEMLPALVGKPVVAGLDEGISSL